MGSNTASCPTLQPSINPNIQMSKMINEKQAVLYKQNPDKSKDKEFNKIPIIAAGYGIIVYDQIRI